MLPKAKHKNSAWLIHLIQKEKYVSCSFLKPGRKLTYFVDFYHFDFISSSLSTTTIAMIEYSEPNAQLDLL